MSYKIIGKYIKKLNFNIPKTENFFLLSKNISNYKINIDITSAQIKQNILTSLCFRYNLVVNNVFRVGYNKTRFYSCLLEVEIE